ncbi:hypothetical protein ACQ4WX_43110 [Streptomyces lasalocidi]
MPRDDIRDTCRGVRAGRRRQRLRAWAPARRQPAGGRRRRPGLHHPGLPLARHLAAARLRAPRPCRVCGHTFRLDDTVYLRHAEDGRLADVTHHLRNLPCSGEAPGASGPPDPGAQAAFFHGVDDTDPRPDTLHTVRLMPDDPVLGRPGRRNACFVCTHTFRLFETVVVCPCSPEAPGCRKAVHQDPARGLGCFEQWRSELTVKQCPMNFRTLRRE